jgi:hypothetical protein
MAALLTRPSFERTRTLRVAERNPGNGRHPIMHVRKDSAVHGIRLGADALQASYRGEIRRSWHGLWVAAVGHAWLESSSILAPSPGIVGRTRVFAPP